MQRKPSSHKGQNGTVAIIGGSRAMHGAPLLAALAAEASGVDLIHVCLPVCHTEVAKQTSLNFFVHPFAGDALHAKDASGIVELLSAVNSAVIGCGATENTAHLQPVIEQCPCTMVLDAGALQEQTLAWVHGKEAILTPHSGEWDRMGLSKSAPEDIAAEHAVTIFHKGPEDTVAYKDGRTDTLTGGNAGLTVGGTGDVLAGLVGGLLAQGADTKKACLFAGNVMKKAGEELFKEKGYAYRAVDIVKMIPECLHQFQSSK